MSTEGAEGVREWLHTVVFADDRVASAVSAAAADAAADLLERSGWDSKAKIADTRMDLFVDNSGLPFEVAARIGSAAMTDAKRAELQARAEERAVTYSPPREDFMVSQPDETDWISPDNASSTGTSLHHRLDAAWEAHKRRMLEEGCTATRVPTMSTARVAEDERAVAAQAEQSSP